MTYTCDDEEFEIVEDPYDEGEWVYDDWDNTCTRDVQCTYDSEGTVTVEGEVTYDNWYFDDFSEDCFAEVYCDDEHMFFDEYSESPSGFGEWTLDDILSDCIREVFCPSSNEVVEQVIPYTFEEQLDTPCPDGSDLGNVIYLYCLDEKMDTYYCSGGGLSLEKLLEERSSKNPELTIKKSLSIYPNPFSDLININIKSSKYPVTYIITTIGGKVVLEGKTTKNISTHKLSKGVYFIKIFTNKKLLLTNKIIKL